MTPDAAIDAAEVEELELELLLEAIARRQGSDLRGYARAGLRRRVRGVLAAERASSISALQERVLRDAAAMTRVVAALTVTAHGLFRDPQFFLTLRRAVVPVLRTYPFVRIWLAGCSTGEEVYSLAIVLAEEGLSSRVRLYATDVSEALLARAKAGVYGDEELARDEARYARAGGRRALGQYLARDAGHLTVAAALRENVVFGQHDLATDRSFNEFNVILCRNVMIHFGAELRLRVHGLLDESLCRLGVLGLGARESLRGSGHADRYEILDDETRLYRRLA